MNPLKVPYRFWISYSLLFFCKCLMVFSFLQTATFAMPSLSLSLQEAILLAVRQNPNVQSSQLNEVAAKFDVCVQKWEFYPHYGFEATANATRNGIHEDHFERSKDLNIKPSVSLLTPIGTQMTLLSSNTKTHHYNPGLSLQIVQPLMRGFGSAIVEAALENAKDSELISRLAIEDTLRNTVSNIVNAYLDVVSAERTISIDEKAVNRANQSVEQTQIFIKAGHKAGNELVTVQANVASAKSQLENDKNNLLQARYALLAAIGIDPNTPIHFANLDISTLLGLYEKPGLDKVKQLALANNIQYQIDQITLHGPTSRSLLIALDNTRWQLNLTANASTGNGEGGGRNAGFHSLYNGENQGQSVGLDLQIPIDDQVAKQAVVNAKIALKEAELALLQEKWSIETNAINTWNLVTSAERSLQFAQDAQALQEKTYNISYQKYLHGLIDSLELQSAQLQLIQSSQTLLSSQINYIKSLVNLDLLLGHTLKTWHVAIRLG